jgi:hypothetical protein
VRKVFPLSEPFVDYCFPSQKVGFQCSAVLVQPAVSLRARCTLRSCTSSAPQRLVGSMFERRGGRVLNRSTFSTNRRFWNMSAARRACQVSFGGPPVVASQLRRYARKQSATTFDKKRRCAIEWLLFDAVCSGRSRSLQSKFAINSCSLQNYNHDKC